MLKQAIAAELYDWLRETGQTQAGLAERLGYKRTQSVNAVLRRPDNLNTQFMDRLAKEFPQRWTAARDKLRLALAGISPADLEAIREEATRDLPLLLEHLRQYAETLPESERIALLKQVQAALEKSGKET